MGSLFLARYLAIASCEGANVETKHGRGSEWAFWGVEMENGQRVCRGSYNESKKRLCFMTGGFSPFCMGLVLMEPALYRCIAMTRAMHGDAADSKM